MKQIQSVISPLSWVFNCSVGGLVALSLMSPAYAGDILRQEERLSRGQSLTSSNGCFQLIMQDDSNLVLYGKGGNPIWSSGTTGTGGEVVVMQGDGNLVVYAPGGRPVWASNTGNIGSNARLVVQNDGNAVVYTSNDKPAWAVNLGQRNCDGSTVSTSTKSFPLSGSRFTELGDHRRMDTKITISANGRIDGVTRIWTAHKYRGFTGATIVAITDSSGNVLYVTQPHSYGVDCRLCPNPSDRTEYWSDSVPQDLLSQVGGYAIFNTTNPRSRWRDWFKEANDAIDEVKKTYSKF